MVRALSHVLFFNPGPVRRVPNPNRYTAEAKLCFCKNNKRMIIMRRRQCEGVKTLVTRRPDAEEHGMKTQAIKVCGHDSVKTRAIKVCGDDGVKV